MSGDDEMREVVERARTGDEAAWREIFDAHYTRLYRFFRSRVGSDELAEDLAADVFVEAFRSIERFEWRGMPFSAWLFGIARHVLASHYRRQQPAPQIVDERYADQAHVRDEFIAIEVRDILDQLRTDYRQALELRYIVGLSGAEAAAVMGRSHGAFRLLLMRATRAYRREAEREGAVPTPEFKATTA